MDYVSVTAKGSPHGPVITCSCQLFGMLQNSVENITEAHNLEQGWQGLSCCHARLMSDIFCIKPFPFIPNTGQLSLPRSYLSESKLIQAEKFIGNQVVTLKSKLGVQKFSVVVDGCDSEMVTIFTVDKVKKTVVTCHSSFCKSQQGKGRTIESISNSENICAHLQKLKEYYDFSDLSSNYSEVEYSESPNILQSSTVDDQPSKVSFYQPVLCT